MRKISNQVTPKSEKYVFITINPKSNGEYTLQEYYDIIQPMLHKALGKVFIEDWIYCYEFTSLTTHPTRGFGLHIHLCIRLTKKHRAKGIAHIRKEFVSTFRSAATRQNIVLRYNSDPTNFVHYIQGFKEGQYKPTHDIDVELRKTIPTLRITPIPMSSDHWVPHLLVEEPKGNSHEFASTSDL